MVACANGDTEMASLLINGVSPPSSVAARCGNLHDAAGYRIRFNVADACVGAAVVSSRCHTDPTARRGTNSSRSQAKTFETHRPIGGAERGEKKRKTKALHCEKEIHPMANNAPHTGVTKCVEPPSCQKSIVNSLGPMF